METPRRGVSLSYFNGILWSQPQNSAEFCGYDRKIRPNFVVWVREKALHLPQKGL